jgi:hypothetical protein
MKSKLKSMPTMALFAIPVHDSFFIRGMQSAVIYTDTIPAAVIPTFPDELNSTKPRIIDQFAGFGRAITLCKPPRVQV